MNQTDHDQHSNLKVCRIVGCPEALWTCCCSHDEKNFPFWQNGDEQRQAEHTDLHSGDMKKAESLQLWVRLLISKVLLPGIRIMMQHEPSLQPLDKPMWFIQWMPFSDHVSLLLGACLFLHHMELRAQWSVPDSLSVYVCAQVQYWSIDKTKLIRGNWFTGMFPEVSVL